MCQAKFLNFDLWLDGVKCSQAEAQSNFFAQKSCKMMNLLDDLVWKIFLSHKDCVSHEMGFCLNFFVAMFFSLNNFLWVVLLFPTFFFCLYEK